jgi:hypothetical protein
MKKVLLVLSAIITVASGVAMVSAYEAHVVNVTAHVEQAIELRNFDNYGPNYHYDFGTVFPEEWLLKRFQVHTSSSFCGTSAQQNRHDGSTTRYFDYTLYVKAKDGYEWLGDALYFTVDWQNQDPSRPKPTSYWLGPGDPGADNMTWVGATMANPSQKPTNPIPILSGRVDKNYILYDEIIMALDVPVFEYYWNEHTDVPEKPSGKDRPTVVIDKEDDPNRWAPGGVDLGAEIKIQITHIGMAG